MTMSLEIVNTSNHTNEMIHLTWPGWGDTREEKTLAPGESVTIATPIDKREEIGVTFHQGESPQPFYLMGKQVFPKTNVGFS